MKKALFILLCLALLALLPACATPTLAEPVPASSPFPDIPLENAATPQVADIIAAAKSVCYK